MSSKVSEFFTQITESYNNLFNKTSQEIEILILNIQVSFWEILYGLFKNQSTILYEVEIISEKFEVSLFSNTIEEVWRLIFYIKKTSSFLTGSFTVYFHVYKPRIFAKFFGFKLGAGGAGSTYTWD